MNQAELQILAPQGSYRPGDEISGEVSWRVAAPPLAAALRLFWRTEGKSDPDVAVAGEITFEVPLAEDRRAFTFRAPAGPPSFSGRLISLVWGLELELTPGGTRVEEIVVGPTGAELDLRRDDWLIVPAAEKPWNWKGAGG